jgi:integrase
MAQAKLKNGVMQRGNKWVYVLRVPDPITGKTKPLWVSGFESASSAKLARDKARVALASNSHVPRTKIAVGEYLQIWIVTHAHHLKPTTLARYKIVINNYLIPEIGSIKLQELRPVHVQNLYAKLLATSSRTGNPLSPRTVQVIGAVLKTALKNAVEVEGIITFNPVSRVSAPKGTGTVSTPLSIPELNTFLETASSHRLGFYFRLSAFTGARRGELLALRWADFDGQAININKTRTSAGNEVVEQNSTKGGTNGQRRVELDPETVELFNAHANRQLVERLALGNLWNETDYVFVQENGLPLYPNTVSGVFKKLLEKSGLRATRLHDLRHLHATELLRLGEPLHVVAQRLGHRDAMVTATIYAHVSDQQAETASTRFANAVSGIG